ADIIFQINSSISDMNGLQVTREIRQLERNRFKELVDSYSKMKHSKYDHHDYPVEQSTAIIAILSMSQDDRETAGEAGANDFLVLPVSFEIFREKVLKWGTIQAI
ncbi:hypothetical protein HK096_008433, partial [Nowakowskiella sp. JEL0078]